MNGIRPKQLARLGQFYLEEAVLDVLLEAKHEGDCIGAAAISRKAGIFRDRGDLDIINDAIVTGILIKLHTERRVQRCDQSNTRRGWDLTDSEFALRRDDVG